jgi:hypothetical protein
MNSPWLGRATPCGGEDIVLKRKEEEKVPLVKDMEGGT